jgi:hypothetical protein
LQRRFDAGELVDLNQEQVRRSLELMDVAILAIEGQIEVLALQVAARQNGFGGKRKRPVAFNLKSLKFDLKKVVKS